MTKHALQVIFERSGFNPAGYQITGRSCDGYCLSVDIGHRLGELIAVVMEEVASIAAAANDDADTYDITEAFKGMQNYYTDEECVVYFPDILWGDEEGNDLDQYEDED